MAADPSARRTFGAAYGMSLLALLLAAPLRAQDVAGALEGRVVAADGAPVPEARVSVAGPALLGRREAVSDARGRFQVPVLPVGVYDLYVSRVGHRAVTRAGVAVGLGAAVDVGDVVLPREAIPVAGATVEASRTRPGRAPPLGGNLAAGVFRALPSDRDYQSIVTLLPHAGASYFGDRANVAGTSGPESNYYVDGVDVVEPPGNALSTSLPGNFIQEVQVRAGGYAAEFGGAGGGVVNAVTASGGNDFGGQAFGFYSRRQFTTQLGSLGVTPATEDYWSGDAGASVGGPLVRDRLWFFGAYDPTLERQQVRLPGFGAPLDRRRMQRFAGKLTARLGERTNLALVAVGDPLERDQIGGVAPSVIAALGNVDPVLARVSQGGINAALRATRTLGTRGFLQADAGVSAYRYVFRARTTRGAAEPLYVDALTSYVEGGVGSDTDRHAGRASGRAVVAYALADHALKAGACWEDEYFRERLALHQITRLGPSLYREITLPDRRSANHLRAPAAFLQDAWRATRRLRLDLGVRWAEEYWMASGGSLGQRIAGEWQPRAGATWTLDRHGLADAFASYGRFYQRTRLNLPGLFLDDMPSTYLVRYFDHDPRSNPAGGVPVFAQTFGHQPAVPGLEGAAFDEAQAGLEWRPGPGWQADVRGVYRTQRSGIVGVISPLSGQAVYGNPGRGELSAYPGIVRLYRALELTVDHGGGAATTWRASYLLSSTRGNYEGYWGQTAGTNDPFGGSAFVYQAGASTFTSGPLPGDRTHQLKLFASRPLGRGLAAGATLVWASGTPLSELGSTRLGPPYFVFLRPRGSLGRTPAIYDLDLRVAYEPPAWQAASPRPRLLADVYHVGNPRRPVVVDQLRYLDVDADGNPATPNPSYGRTLLFQPAVAYRFGIEVSW